MRNGTLQHYMREHLSLYIFVGVIFITGVVFGAVMVNALSLEQKQEIARLLNHFFVSVQEGTLLGDQQTTFWQSFSLHMKWILIVWVLGLSIIGLPLILILDFLKGVLIGFTVGYMIGQLSWKGLLFALVSVVPQNAVAIPALILCSVTAMAFSINMVKNRFYQRKGAILNPFVRFTASAAACMALMAGVALFEAHITPVMMKWVTPMLIVSGL